MKVELVTNLKRQATRILADRRETKSRTDNRSPERPLISRLKSVSAETLFNRPADPHCPE
jgi:hypothetical protein